MSANVASVQIVDRAGDREGLMIFNDSVQTLYLRLGTANATVSDWSVKLPPGAYWEMGNNTQYYGAVQGIWAAADASGKARVTEIG